MVTLKRKAVKNCEWTKENENYRDWNKIIGQIIRKTREEAHMSVEELATKIHLMPMEIEAYEEGMVMIGILKLYDISRFFGKKIDYFFTGLEKTTTKVSGE